MPLLVKHTERFVNGFVFWCQRNLMTFFVVGQLKTTSGTLVFFKMAGHISCSNELVPEERAPHPRAK